MSRARSNSPSTAAAFESQGSGCFSGYILPPLAVIVVGALLALFAFSLTPRDLNAQAAAPGTPAQSPLLDAAVQAIPPAPITAPADPSASASSGSASADQIAGPPPAPQSPLQLTFPDASVQVAPSTSTQLSPVFTPQVQYWARSLSRWAATAGLDPNLAAVVMQIESCGDPSATSRSGAIGLFQVMPYHFLASDSPYDPDTNAARGLDYLRRSLAAAHNDARLAFAGYNGGIGVISRSEWTWPAETVRYAYWGSGIYADAIGGGSDSGRLHEWITAGGSGLCSHASQRLGLNN
jgi:soluble lytic murein transglycosylase-like protein